MKLNIISDLHCATLPDGNVEWFDFEPERLEPADYLIVAGDTGYAQNEHIIHKDLREKTQGKFKQVLTIKGNHSYWVTQAYEHEEIPESYQLSMAPNDTVEIVDGDVAIIGTTLWTNSCNFSEIRYMNDYPNIPAFTAEIKLKRFEQESNWLRQKWNEYNNKGKKVVVVTHHNPRSPEILPEHSMEHYDVYTSYWVVNGVLDDIKPDIWVCGHIHEDFDAEIDGVRIVRHPIGYRFGYYRYDPVKWPHHKAIMDSWYNKVVEI